MFDKGQKQLITLSCDSRYCIYSSGVAFNAENIKKILGGFFYNTHDLNSLPQNIHRYILD